jgi:hypothetical protein
MDRLVGSAMRKLTICLLALLAACARGEEDDRNLPANEQAPGPAAAPAEKRAAVPVADLRSPEAAARVLRDYFALVGAGQYQEAFRLWSADPAATDLSGGAFAASFDRYASYRGVVGEPGRVEGAAGSLYVQIPVTVTGTLKSGEDFRQSGTFILRRANDVPGATAEQLQWRIYRADLKPRQVQASYRFVGRWATDGRNCATRAWLFTASSLKTPAGSVCSFSRVTDVPGGYDVRASCMAEGPARDDLLRLRFAESARALLFESRTIADAGLVRCR